MRCGQCGRKLYVRYWGKSGTSARYLCIGDYGAGTGCYCVGFGGGSVDRRLSEEVLRVLSPLGLRASLAALDSIDADVAGRRRMMERHVEELEYEAARAFEQYNAVDARNRLVASELEQRWNTKLEALEAARSRLTEHDERERPLSEQERAAVKALGERFADVWSHPACPIEVKKQIVRAVIEEVLVDEKPPGELSFIVHWKGGSHTRLTMKKVSPQTSRVTTEDDLDVIRKMATRYGDNVIAAVLNRLGRRTGAGRRWSRVAVHTARRNHGIAGHTTSVADPDVLSLGGAIEYTQASDTTIRKLVAGGVLPMRQVVPYAPWEIRRADLDSPEVRKVLDHLRRTGRLVLRGTLATQRQLFQ